MLRVFMSIFLAAGLLAAVPATGQTAEASPEAKLVKYPTTVSLGANEERCGEYFVFRNWQGTDSISYWEEAPGVPPMKYGYAKLEKVEVVLDSSKDTPTVQTVREGGTVKGVTFRITEAELVRSACLKDKVKK